LYPPLHVTALLGAVGNNTLIFYKFNGPPGENTSSKPSAESPSPCKKIRV